MKRICLFAGYNYNNKISQYVIDYLKELSNYCDIYYLADGTVNIEQFELIKPYVKNAWVEKHKKYDFGSWSLLAQKYVGWDVIEKYDELIFANDSCFCVNSFKPVFEKMNNKPELDFWGLNAADNANITEFSNFSDYIKKGNKEFYIGSYFLAFRASFFKKEIVQNFINNVNVANDRNIVCNIYEFELLQLAQRENANIDVYNETVWRYSTVYMRDAFNLIKSGFPLLKVRIFVDNIGGSSLTQELAEACAKYCDFNYLNYIENIKKERKCKKYKRIEKKNFNSKIKNIKHYYIPEFILLIFRFKTYKQLFSKQNVNKFLKLIFPPVVHDLKNSILHSKKMKNDKNNYKFCITPKPKYGSCYPCHLKNYNKIHEQRVLKLKNSKQMIIFFNVMRNVISGGMLSIDRFIEHSLPIAKEKGFNVVLSGLPLDNACIYNSYFDYSIEPIDFKYIVKYCKPEKLVLNIPECFIPDFINKISAKEYIWLFAIKDLRINILNQNDELMPSQNCIEELRTLCNNKLTITAAHKSYCTDEKSKQYNAPVYLLTPFLPNFIRTPFEQKEKIIVLSPDNCEYKQALLKTLKKELPDYKIVTVEGMHLNDYKKLISKAMFTITFGEGYDGYFLEPYLSDSIGFCVLNKTFFPKEFKKQPTTYSSWSEMLNNIVEDIKKYENNENLYTKVSNDCEKEIRKFTNNKQSETDLIAYYERIK